MTAKKPPQVPGAPVLESGSTPELPVQAEQTPTTAPAAKTVKPAAKVDKNKPYLSPEGWVLPTDSGSK